MNRRFAPVSVLLAFAALLAGWPAGAEPDPELDPPPPGLTAREVADRVEQVFRGDTTYIDATMIIRSPRLPEPRAVRFRSWDDRSGKRSFIRIVSPPKDKGMTFLKLHPNLWNYIPRVERTVRIPPSMMLQSWMGSDFSNDDLVRESSQLDDYDHRWLGVDPSPAHPESERAYRIEYIPREDAPVVWGRIVAAIDVARMVPLWQAYYDEDGTKMRMLRYADFAIEGRPFPLTWVMTPLDKEGHETRVEVHEIRFDEPLDDRLFTKRAMSRPVR